MARSQPVLVTVT